VNVNLKSLHKKEFQERRHMIGGIILLTILFAGHYIPVTLSLLLLVVITWMALLSYSGFLATILISGLSFLIPFGILAYRNWNGIGMLHLGPAVSSELSLELSVLFSMIFGAAIWVRAILRSKKAGFDEVVGAINLYAWIATIYGCLYTVISRLNPHAFLFHDTLIQALSQDQMRHNFNELFYFSFVTQTTVGYGDILPISHFARSLAVSQAMIGQFYVAVVLTYILNLWISDLKKPGTPDGVSKD